MLSIIFLTISVLALITAATLAKQQSQVKLVNYRQGTRR